MLCLTCQRQADCLIQQLAAADSAVRELMQQLKHCDRHLASGSGTQESPLKT